MATTKKPACNHSGEAAALPADQHEVFVKAADACTACPHRGGTLPSDWHALDFFDRRAVAGQTLHRLECTAVPDNAKPCLNREPAPASQALTATKTAALPTVQQAIALSLMAVRWSLQHALDAINRDFDGDDAATAPYSSTLVLVRCQLDTIAAAAPTSWNDCDALWWQAYEATQLVARTLQRGDCLAQRHLDSALKEFEALADAMQLLDDRMAQTQEARP